ncbi:MAG: hypothetical protein KJ052_05735 [Candidatus Hydrogenedentes bacterium]|nr:hypothetical protein [Candidatus Hydrogenedentota bacterium]
MAHQTILSTSVNVDISSAAKLRIETVHTVQSDGGQNDAFYFLLNPGLKVSEVFVNNVSTVAEQNGWLISIPAKRRPGTASETNIRIVADGLPILTASSAGLLTNEKIVLSRQSIWYPQDLKSFVTFDCAVGVPSQWSVAAPANAGDVLEEGGRRRISWAVEHPVLSAALMAGPYERQARLQGSVSWSIYYPANDKPDTESYFRACGDAFNACTALWGGDDSKTMTMLLDQELKGPCRGDNDLIAMAPGRDEEGGFFIEVARQVARNWWGGMVTDPWLSDGGSAWLSEGMSEYTAWLAYRNTEGFQRFLKSHERMYFDPEALGPLKLTTLLDVSEWPAEKQAYHRIKGAYMARMLTEQLGQTAFIEGARNFLAIHKYGGTDYEGLRHEWELSGQTSLSEFFSAWFEKSGAYDYAITNVRSERDKLTITIESVGNLAALQPLEVGLIGPKGMELHDLDIGAKGGIITLHPRNAMNSVVLDPLFSTPDMARGNNVWPRRTWPRGVSAAGRVAVWWGNRDWYEASPTLLSALHDDGVTVDTIALPGPLIQRPVMRSNRIVHLAFLCDTRASRSLYVYGANQKFQVYPEPQMRQLLGWQPDGTIVGMSLDDASPTLILGKANHTSAFVSVHEELTNGLLAPRPFTTEAAFSSAAASPGLVIIDLESNAEVFALPTDATVLALQWTDDGKSLLFATKSGSIEIVTPESGAAEPLLALDYTPYRIAFAPTAKAVAWIDPAHRLRFARLDEKTLQYFSLSEEALDMAWLDEDAVLCLAKTELQDVPMLFHAEYTLWRAPLAGNAERLRVAPDRAN